MAADTSNRHGGPQDRGSADAWYQRERNPHKYAGATGHGPEIKLTDSGEIAAYNKAFDDGMATGDHKEWD